jgi:hypothetical protein
MEIIFGTLSIDEPTLTSLLEPGDNWLLLSGFPDPEQAGRAATNFIMNVRHLPNAAPVAVTGTRNTIGTQPVIIMTDINAAGNLMQHAMIAMKEGKAAKVPARKKKGGRKTPVKKVKPGGHP